MLPKPYLIPLDMGYQWLANENSPKILVQMLALYGVKEAPGSADNPTILAWAKETQLDSVYKHDQTSWCGLTMAVVVQRAGYQVVEAPALRDVR